jgi:hypothetical protein
MVGIQETANEQLFEVQLLREQWFQLHGRHHQEELGRIRDVDQHSLNQAARTVLDKAGERPFANEISLIFLTGKAFGM